jgi:hypothetical protein
MKARLGIIVGLIVVIQLAALGGQYAAAYWTQKTALSEVKQRISLDVNALDLGTQNIHSVANRDEIVRYISRLNGYLAEHAFPLRIVGLGNVSDITPDDESSKRGLFENTSTDWLLANERKVAVQIASQSLFSSSSLSIPALLTGLLFWFLTRTKTNETEQQLPSPL